MGGQRRRVHGTVVERELGLGGALVEVWSGAARVASAHADHGGAFELDVAAAHEELRVVVRFHDQKVGEAPAQASGPTPIAATAPQPSATVIAASAGKTEIAIARAEHPLAATALCDVPATAVRVTGPAELPETLVRVPFERGGAAGIQLPTVKLFRYDEQAHALVPIWNSGCNAQLGFVWGKVHRPGLYVAHGLPSDKLLLELLRAVAVERRASDAPIRSLIERTGFSEVLASSDEQLEAVRAALTEAEHRTAETAFAFNEVRYEKGRLVATTLPKAKTFGGLRDRLRSIDGPAALAEEQLFYPPDGPRGGAPWARKHGTGEIQWALDRRLPVSWLCRFLPWACSQDWWMYQHDGQHTGHASGLSNINSTSVSRMIGLPAVNVNGPIITQPAIVAGKIFVGTSDADGQSVGSRLYKIDLVTGVIESTFDVDLSPNSDYGINGFGGTPCIVGNRAYFSALNGKIYCVDHTTNPMTLEWKTNLKAADVAQNQPVNNPNADSWSGALVANGKVYVGCGEGEGGAWGFVYCLDATSGHVVWLFCTNQFVNGTENLPNHIPQSSAVNPLPAGFTTQPDPAFVGSSVWSSCAFDSGLNTIYVGTGNPQPDGPVPSAKYSSGLIALDATTGTFKGFFQPAPTDNYYDDDTDIDVPGSATVYSTGGHKVAFGTKAGAFFVLDGSTMNAVARRQLLPRANGDGTPANRGTALSAVFGGGGGEDNKGIYATPALGGNRLYVGLGGDDGISDPAETPFLRAVDWVDALDRWPTSPPDAAHVVKYSDSDPPMYLTGESGLGSPSVVNDVVFMATSIAGANLYALDGATGTCLWKATNLGASGASFVMGSAIYGDYVVIGAGAHVYRYWLSPFIFPWPWPRPWPIYIQWPWPPPPPDPGPIIDPTIDQTVLNERLRGA